jgi:tetratricopeptide (TPR) repeat protein
MRRYSIKLFVITYAVCFIFITSISHAADKDIYKKSVDYITNYELEKGLRGMNKVIYSANSTEDLKIKSYMWVAFVKLFDGDTVKASEAIKEMFEHNMGLEYDLNKLPLELSENIQLLDVYKKEKASFLKNIKKREKAIDKHLKKAKKYYINNQLTQSAFELDMLFKIDPGNKDALDLKEQIRQKDSSILKVRENMEELYEDAKKAYDKGEFDKASEIIESILDVEPNNLELIELKELVAESKKEKEALHGSISKRLKRSRKLYEKGHLDRAKEELKSVLEIEPGNETAIELVNKIQMAEIKSETLKGGVESVDIKEEFSLAEIYNKALVHIDNYEMNPAYSMMKKIVNSKSALEKLKAQAHLWISFIELFNGQEKKARRIVRNMLESEIGTELKKRDLPERITQNATLMKIYEEEKESYFKKNNFPRFVARGTKKAKKYYLKGELERAEVILDNILSIYPDYQDSSDLRSKVRKIMARRAQVKSDLVDKYYENAKLYYKSGKMMFAIQETSNALKINPQFQKAYNLFHESYKSLERDLDIGSEKDKKILQKALNYYLMEEFNASEKVFRKLQNNIPEADILLNQSMAYVQEKQNRSRAKYYYDLAVKSSVTGRYEKAKADLMTALALDEDCLDALILMEVVSEEISQ